MGVCKAELFCPSPVYSTAVSSVKGVLWLSLGQESYCSRLGPFTFHMSEIRLNCMFTFSSRHRFHQWWEARRQDPDSSYIVLYRHTTCPEAMEKNRKKKTSWVQRRYFKRFNLSTKIVSMHCKTKHPEGKWQQMPCSWASFMPCCEKQGPQTPVWFSCKIIFVSFTKAFWSAICILPL